MVKHNLKMLFFIHNTKCDCVHWPLTLDSASYQSKLDIYILDFNKKEPDQNGVSKIRHEKQIKTKGFHMIILMTNVANKSF